MDLIESENGSDLLVDKELVTNKEKGSDSLPSAC